MPARRCDSCEYWSHDRGMWTFTRWSKATDNDGTCHKEPDTRQKHGEDFCGEHTPKSTIIREEQDNA